MYVGKKNGWYRYSTGGDWNLSSIKDCGKWMHFFNDSQFAIEMIDKALELEVTKYAKHTGGSTGVVCFYASGTDYDNHQKVLKFFLDHNLVRLTPSYKYTDISFKFNGQSWSKEYGPNFEGMIKLSNFVNLETGEFKSSIAVEQLLVVEQFPISRGLRTDQTLCQLIEQINYFVTRKINTIFNHQPEAIDFNDKLMYLSPLAYKTTKLFELTTNQLFLEVVTKLLDWLLTERPARQSAKIERVMTSENSEFQTLISLFTENNLSDEGLCSKFNSTFNHNIFDQAGYSNLGYLIYLGLLAIDPKQFDKLI